MAEKQIEKLTGQIIFLKSHAGSKSEAVLPYLYRGRETDALSVYLEGDNPFENTGLTAYDGQTVELTGSMADGKFTANSVKEI